MGNRLGGHDRLIDFCAANSHHSFQDLGIIYLGPLILHITIPLYYYTCVYLASHRIGFILKASVFISLLYTKLYFRSSS